MRSLSDFRYNNYTNRLKLWKKMSPWELRQVFLMIDSNGNG